MNERELTELFRRLGAQEPEDWARSQIREGIPQLLRYLFLRQARRQVVAPGDRDWMTVREDDPDDRDEFGEAIDAVLATGVSAQDLTTVVRIMQWIILFRFCVLLDGGLAFRTDAGHSTLQGHPRSGWLIDPRCREHPSSLDSPDDESMTGAMARGMRLK
jgi:hypothetical protein